MTDAYQTQLRNKLERLPYAKAPQPWREVGVFSVGGLTEIGFADNTDDLLVVSSQGRGLFDCLTGKKLARDHEENFERPVESSLTAPGIGNYTNTLFRMAGLHGGGLSLLTDDGWGIHVVQLPWPIHVVFLTRDFKGITDEAKYITKLCDDEPCSFRAAGFSAIGQSFVIATSGELRIYARDRF